MKESKVEPELLFHYTSYSGLLGILQSKTLWATSVRHLYDEKELKLGLELVIKRIEETLISDDLKSKLIIDINRRKRLRLGAISFSGRDDLLSQWRGYAPKGCCIGFSHAALLELVNRQSFFMMNCLYDDQGINSLSHEIRSIIVKLSRETYYDEGVDRFCSYAAFVKHSSFDQEDEHRIVTSGPFLTNSWEYRVGDAGIIPYVRFGLSMQIPTKQQPFVQIRVGPGQDFERAENAIRLLIESCCPGIEIPILPSDVPLVV